MTASSLLATIRALTINPRKSFLLSLVPAIAVSVAVCGALLLMQYTLAMPTEDARARAYHLIRSSPYVFAPFFVVMLTGASVAALWVTAGLSTVAVVSSVAVAAAGTAILYAGVLDVVVWVSRDDVTTAGQFLRMAIASLGAATVMLWARRHPKGRSATD